MSSVNTFASNRVPVRLVCLGPLALALGCAAAPAPGGLEGMNQPIQLPAAPVGSPVDLHGQLQVDGAILKDKAGSPIQLKGASSMWLNWESSPFAESKGGLQYMRDHWNLSVFRASMGTDSSQGYLNGNAEVMLQKVETIVQNAIRLGVYVIVDWHTEKAVDQQADAVAFFAAMARRYGGYPNVIWETYNEPKGYAWPAIKAYHEAVVDAIRAVDPDNLIVMGTPTYSQDVDIASAAPVAPASGTQNLLYTLHFYSCTHNQRYRDKANTAIANGAALFITEFGATPSDGGLARDPYVCRDEANLWFDWMAQNTISGVAWKLDNCADSSCILGPSASAGGSWSDDVLSTDVNNTTVVAGGTSGGGHGVFVVNWMRQ